MIGRGVHWAAESRRGHPAWGSAGGHVEMGTVQGWGDGGGAEAGTGQGQGQAQGVW